MYFWAKAGLAISSITVDTSATFIPFFFFIFIVILMFWSAKIQNKSVKSVKSVGKDADQKEK
ncbi:hypothetical protein DXC61_14250 [Segatella copri]|uniref:Uncharacterized protein n=1 Tax=Segatella copri TaxID=165179 RepID=A0AA93B716_9BACT|nr:hypothetical protein DXC61_14250 [Segatella copri]